MNRRTLTFLAIVALASSAVVNADAPRVQGTANCAFDAENRCLLDAKLRLKDDSYHYTIEHFDVKVQQWTAVSNRFANESQIASEPLEAGHIYRVLACKGRETMSRCVATPAQWAPVLPSDVADIPAAVEAADGTSYGVSKNLSLAEQTQQYNVYLVEQLLSRTKAASMPPMSTPQAMPSQKVMVTSDRDLLAYAVYLVYESRRAE
ncbi:MAG: hypothetical protein KJO55_08645 [Gammaproteobacteria bacterium]|nr:hypothetical protein [Gammaproteobacteria bacterium]